MTIAANILAQLRSDERLTDARELIRLAEAGNLPEDLMPDEAGELLGVLAAFTALEGPHADPTAMREACTEEFEKLARLIGEDAIGYEVASTEMWEEFDEILAPLRAPITAPADQIHGSFSDYDHENERHAEVVVHGSQVRIDRWIDHNSDYAPDDDPPDDWSDTVTLEFDDPSHAAAFAHALGLALIDACFSLYERGEELSSDDARDTWGAKLAVAPMHDARIDALVNYPR